MKKINYAIGIVSAAAVILPALAFGATARFQAELRNSEEVPATNSSSSGNFEIEFNEARDQAAFMLNVYNGTAVEEAHIHCGPRGSNGPVVATLFGNVPGGFNVHGTLSDFTLTDANIAAIPSSNASSSCNIPVETVGDVLQLINRGEAYVNVHDAAHPSGAIRGQLTATSTSTDIGTGSSTTTPSYGTTTPPMTATSTPSAASTTRYYIVHGTVTGYGDATSTASATTTAGKDFSFRLDTADINQLLIMIQRLKDHLAALMSFFKQIPISATTTY